MLEFPSQIWEILTGSDTIRVSQIRNGKWLAEGGFYVTNLGKFMGGAMIVAEGPPAREPYSNIEGEPRSTSNF